MNDWRRTGMGSCFRGYCLSGSRHHSSVNLCYPRLALPQQTQTFVRRLPLQFGCLAPRRCWVSLIMLVLLGPFFAVLAAFFLWPVSLIAAFVGLSLNRAARHRLSKRQYRTALRCTAIILVGAVAVLAFRQYLEDNPIHPGPSCFQLALRCRMPRGAEILQFHQTEPFLDHFNVLDSLPR